MRSTHEKYIRWTGSHVPEPGGNETPDQILLRQPERESREYEILSREYE
jgi:hypothetical protein